MQQIEFYRADIQDKGVGMRTSEKGGRWQI